MVQCRVCNKEVTTNNALLDSYDNTWICTDCFDEYNYLQCTTCGKIVKNARGKDWLLDSEGHYRCKSCRDKAKEQIHICSCCGNIVPNSRVARTITRRVRNNHKQTAYSYFEVPVSYEEYTDVDYYICNDCADNQVEFCEDCCKIILPKNGSKYYKINGLYYCISCGESHSHVKKYGHKPSKLLFYNNTKSKEYSSVLYIGTELEFDSLDGDREALAEDILTIMGEERCYITRDGSLSQENGLEVATMPMSYNYYTNNKQMLESLFESVREHGYSGDMNCGLHFHVSKSYFGDELNECIYKLNRILANSILDGSIITASRKTKKDILRFSVPQGQYLMIDNIEEYYSYREGIKKVNKLRNVALNETDKTLEFRFFKSTTDVSTFYSSLYLVFSLCAFAKELISIDKAKSMSLKDFLGIK